MKRISKNKIEFDCIVRSINSTFQTDEKDFDRIEIFVNYFDQEDEINLVWRGKVDAEHLQKLQEAYNTMKVLKIVLEVKDQEVGKFVDYTKNVFRPENMYKGKGDNKK